MPRTLAVFSGGILLGALAVLFFDRLASSGGSSPVASVREIANVPKMAVAASEKHRAERYIGLTRIEDIAALPSEFARASALVALAGRTDAAGVQRLIFEANRVADPIERTAYLDILFFRLAESDPPSALALARTDPFDKTRDIERTVWRAWARHELDDALFAAKTQTTLAHRNMAAQSLYAAFGYGGNDITDRIREEIEIGPDRATRARYLYQLADRSPAEAINFINEHERGGEQRDYVSWLAYYLSMQDPMEALRFADLFRVAANSELYSSIISNDLARENPQATIDRLLASGERARSRGELRSAIRALVSIDLDAAKRYFEQARSSNERRTLGAEIAAALAESDPLEAMRWARANEKDRHPYLQMSVLSRVAQTKPQLALAEALKTPNLQAKAPLVANVVQQIGQSDPVAAAALLDGIGDRSVRRKANEQLATVWMYRDPDAAIEWILSHDDQTAQRMLPMAANRLVRSNVDAAIKLLPRLDASTQASMRQHIATRLAADRSLGDAQAFVRQFEGQRGYESLQASVIEGVAQSDVMLARQLADQLAAGPARDRAYVHLISQQAQVDPPAAMQWLNNIGNEQLRGSAAGHLVSSWHESDPDDALRWVDRLPVGPVRDDAIVQLSFRWGDTSAEHDKLIASIGDRQKRGQAKVRRVIAVMGRDPVRARQLLDDDDIPAEQRRNLEMTISQHALRF